jgi:pentatricopeptide repeat protein
MKGDTKAMEGVLETMRKHEIPIEQPMYVTIFTTMAHEQAANRYRVDHRVQAYEIMTQIAREQDQGLTENLVTVELLNSYLSIFTSIHAATQVTKCLDLFSLYGLQPDLFTYTLLIKMYTQINATHKAVELIRTMRNNGIEPDALVYRHMINAVCNTNQQLAIEYLRSMTKKSMYLTKTDTCD